LLTYRSFVRTAQNSPSLDADLKRMDSRHDLAIACQTRLNVLNDGWIPVRARIKTDNYILGKAIVRLSATSRTI